MQERYETSIQAACLRRDPVLPQTDPKLRPTMITNCALYRVVGKYSSYKLPLCIFSFKSSAFTVSAVTIQHMEAANTRRPQQLPQL